MSNSDFEPHEQDQYDALAAHLAKVMAEGVKQTDTDRLIQYSSYGYALWGYLFASRSYPSAGDVPGKLMVVAAGAPDWVCHVQSDDPCGDQNDYLHDAYANQKLGNVGCWVNISSACTNLDECQLFMRRGEVCVYWSSCSNCYTWLSAMARAEREPVDGDPKRKAKHILEVPKMWGDPVRNLSRYMRNEDPLAVARRVLEREW